MGVTGIRHATRLTLATSLSLWTISLSAAERSATFASAPFQYTEACAAISSTPGARPSSAPNSEQPNFSAELCLYSADIDSSLAVPNGAIIPIGAKLFVSARSRAIGEVTIDFSEGNLPSTQIESHKIGAEGIGAVCSIEF